jgi:hypothetical protein
MRLVGLELAGDELRVAEGERGVAGTRLLGVARIPVPDARALEHALDEIAARRPGRVLSALPLAATTHRFLTLPFRDRRRLARTAPLELLGRLPGEIAGVRVATERVGATPDGSVVLAVAVHQTDAEEHAAVLAARGLALERLDLVPLPVWNLLDAGDAALLVADGRASTLSLRAGGRLAALRALAADAADPDPLVAECRHVLAAFGAPPARLVVAGPDGTPALVAALADATGLEVATLAEASALSLPEPANDAQACAVALGMLAGAGRAGRVGLELRPARRASPPGAWRRATALAAAAAVLALANVGIERVRLARYDALLVREIATVAAAALPGEPIVAPRAQLEAAVEADTSGFAAHRSAPVLEVLRELSARVPPALLLDVHELVVDDEGIRVHGRAPSFDAVDSLARALGASPLLAEVRTEETRTAVDGRGVLFRLGAKRRPPAGTSL